MNSPSDSELPAPSVPSRRSFILKAAGATALLCVRGESAETTATAAAPDSGGGFEGVYQCFSPEEAEFAEAMVDHMCPPDEFTPGGVDCGLATFIDRQLAGAYGQGDRLYLRGPFRTGLAEDGYQLPLTPSHYFKMGVRAFDEACVLRWGSVFAQLNSTAKESALSEIATGRWDEGTGFPLGAWFNELIYPLFTQACFSDPLYGGNHDKVFWRLLGYPGLPAVHSRDMVTYRGKPYPGARTPRSMEDFA